MADQSKRKYSFDHIRRYFSRGMSPAEMHRMEMDALQDPFLADAMEGFQQADLSKAKTDLDQINSTIKENKGKAATVKRFSTYTWWRIAAIFIVAAGLVAVINYMAGNKENESSQQIAAVREKSNQAIPAQPDSQVAIAKPKFDTSHRMLSKTLPAEEEQLLAEKKPVPEPVPQVETSSADEKKDSPIARRESAVAMSARAMRSTENLRPGFTIRFNGMVTDQMGKPLPEALIIARGIAAVYTDRQGNFSFRSPENKVNITIAATGFKPQDKDISSSGFNVVRLSATDSSQSAATVSKLGNEVPVMEDAENTAVPAGGWQLFQTYVREKILLEADSMHENVSIRFSIDQNGRPYDFIIAAPAAEAAAVLAKNILLDGPPWISINKDTKASIVMKF